MALANPLRLEIHKRLTALLEEITVANGYLHELEGKVFRGRNVFGDKDPLPMLSILEVPIPLDLLPSPGDSPASNGPWELMIQGFAVDDRANPTDPAHILLADVKRRLAIERKKRNFRAGEGPAAGILGLGNNVTDLIVGPGVVRPPDEISAKAYFWLTMTLELVEDLEDPYESGS